MKKPVSSEDNFSMLQESSFRRPIIANFWIIVFQQFSGFVLLTSKLKYLYGVLHMCKTISAVVAVTLLQVFLTLTYN